MVKFVLCLISYYARRSIMTTEEYFLEMLSDTSAALDKDLDNFIYQMEINYEIDK